jgi:hypothetical protein
VLGVQHDAIGSVWKSAIKRGYYGRYVGAVARGSWQGPLQEV